MENDFLDIDALLNKFGIGQLADGSTISNNFDWGRLKRYIPSSYPGSYQKQLDEIYGGFEFCLLDVETGLRFRVLATESYDGEDVEYRLGYVFVLDHEGNFHHVEGIDNSRKLIITEIGELPFFEVSKRI